MRIDAAFEIAIAGEHGGRHQIALGDGIGDRFGERAGIADAGGAAIAHQIEAEFIEGLVEAGILQIIGHHLRTGRERGFHPGLHGEAQLDRLLGDEARTQHARTGSRCWCRT